MNPVPEGFLLAVASIAATLIGLLLLGASSMSRRAFAGRRQWRRRAARFCGPRRS